MVACLVDEWFPFWVIYRVDLRDKSSFDSLAIDSELERRTRFSSSAESSRQARAICDCPRCHPGKNVSLRTSQRHILDQRESQIAGEVVNRPLAEPAIDDSAIDRESLNDEESIDDEEYRGSEPLFPFLDEAGMDDSTGCNPRR
jgi:hypothetical protein